MTGFARVEGSEGAWSWAVEARSVNGRNLEVRFRCPPGFDLLEKGVRDGAQARFQRGQVNVGLQARRAESTVTVSVNVEQMDRYLALLAPLVKSGRAQPPTADGLLALRGVLEAVDTEGVPPTTRAVEVVNVTRDDVVVPTEVREQLLDEAPQREGDFFRVPKILTD